MKVKELIDYLSQIDGDIEVGTQDRDAGGDYSTYSKLEGNVEDWIRAGEAHKDKSLIVLW